MRYSSILILAVAVLVAACAPSSSTPTVAQSEAALKADVQKESGGKIAVVSFTKTEAQAAEIYGVPVYKLKYKAMLRTTGTATIGRSEHSAYAPSVISGSFEVPAGHEYEIDGSIEFEKKESGWVATDINARRLPNKALEALIPPAKAW